MKDKISKKVENIRFRFSNLKLKSKNLFKYLFNISKKPFSFIAKLVGYSIIYGLIVNYMLTGIFGISFRIWSFPAYGVLVYLVKEELPLVWNKFKSNK